jgi:hypothetical protein
MVSNVLRFSDLKARGVVNNRATLSRWIKKYGFPSGFMLGPNSRGWYEHELEEWLRCRHSGQGEKWLVERGD